MIATIGGAAAAVIAVVIAAGNPGGPGSTPHSHAINTHLHQRIEEGCGNLAQLFREISARARAYENRLPHSDLWQEKALPGLSQMVTGATEQLRLTPTARSLLQ